MDLKVIITRLIDANARLAKPEVFDPFHVPGKGQEMKSFAMATSCATTFLFALYFVPFEGRNLLVFGLLATVAAGSLVQGFRDRDHRLNRLEAVEVLKESLLDEKAPSCVRIRPITDIT